MTSFLDEILVNFRMFGRYHGELMVYLAIAYLCNGLYSVNYIFAAEEISYRCKDELFENNTCGKINSSKCTEFVYDQPNSFVAEYDLGCEEWKRTFVGTAHSLGYMFGLPIIGSLSDRLGRKKAVIITGVLGGLLGLAKSASAWYWLYVVFEILEAAFGDIFSPVYILTVEMVETRKRVPYYIISFFGFSIGCTILAFVAWEVQYWRTFLRVIYAPSLLFIFYSFLIDESPRWLLTKGRKEEAVKTLQNAAKKNKIEIDITALDKMVYEDEKEMALTELLKTTFASKTLLLRFFVCTTWWATSTFVNYGMTINSVSLQGNKYMNFAIVAIIDGPGNVLIMFVMMKYKRKKPLLISFFVGAAMYIVQPFLPLNQTWLSIVVYTCGKLVSSFCFNITYMYTSELFPTQTRNSMQALCSSLGRIGSILAPQTPLLKVYWDGLPMMIFCGAAIFAGLATFLVPDTAGDSLPDTVRQAEEIGTKKLSK
ncbi:organic cation transporter protein [Bombyx mori]|uniref:Major facilitator superfamily (MFS) profile domain-containing protein n=1 Tax=Bombyx mori TaxID=7091 RepID=A0A8R2QWW8_BOMMO|nr:organic cation transporter protein [Bombyx mori]